MTGLTQPSWSQLAEVGKLDEAVVEYVRRRDWVTMVEIEGLLAPHVEIHGDLAWEMGDTGVVLWVGMSREFVDLLLALTRDKRLFVHPTSWLTYLIDGGTLKLPLARRLPAGGYKRDHWLPICLRIVPLVQKQKRGKKARPAVAAKAKIRRKSGQVTKPESHRKDLRTSQRLAYR